MNRLDANGLRVTPGLVSQDESKPAAAHVTPHQNRPAVADGGPRGGYGAAVVPGALGAQRVAQATGAPSRASVDPFVTVFISTIKQGDEQPFGMPEQVEEALKALHDKYKGEFVKLEVNELGSSLFDTDAVYKVRASLTGALKAACANLCTATPLDDIIRAPAWDKPLDASVIDRLKNGSPVERASIVAALQNGIPGGLDVNQKRELLSAIANQAATASALYSGVVRDLIQPRRKELADEAQRLADQQGVPKSVGRSIGGYLEAGAIARAELRQAGGTPEINALAAQLLACTRALAAMQTPGAYAMIDQMMTQAGGIIFDDVVSNPDLARRIVDTWASKVIEVTTKTAEALATGEGRVSSSSGGRYYLGSRYETASSNAWSEDYPFSEIRSNVALFLGATGTQAAQAAATAIERVILDADAKLPVVLAAHKARYVQRELGGLPESITSKPDRLAQHREGIERRYREQNALTGLGETSKTIAGLSSGTAFDATSYAQEAAVTLRGNLLVKLLTSVQRAETRDDLVDASIGYYVLSTQAPEAFATPVAQATLSSVLATATGPLTDAAVAAKAGTVLAGKGCVAMFPHVVEALRRGDDGAKSNAMNVLDAYFAVAGGSLEGISNPDGFKSMTPAQRAQLGELARSTSADLRGVFATGTSVWVRIDSARLLAMCGATDLEAEVAYLRDMASPTLSSVRFSSDHGGVKNETVRAKAIGALAVLGKSAASARADLEAIAAVGTRAAELQSYLTSVSTGYDFLAELHPEASAKCKAFLESVAAPNTQAQACLDFVTRTSLEEIKKIPSYARGDRPFMAGVVGELARLGAAAQRAIDAIDGKPAPSAA